MADEPKSRPVLIPPLRAARGRLEMVRELRQHERPKAEHPHCDEHFLFVPHCAACLEAERSQVATAQGERIEKPTTPSPRKPARGSRSFGFTGPITPSMFESHSLHRPILEPSAGDDLTDMLSDLLELDI